MLTSSRYGFSPRLLAIGVLCEALAACSSGDNSPSTSATGTGGLGATGAGGSAGQAAGMGGTSSGGLATSTGSGGSPTTGAAGSSTGAGGSVGAGGAASGGSASTSAGGAGGAASGGAASGGAASGGAGGGGAGPNPACPATSLPVGESAEATIASANGVTYTYTILVPPSYDPNKPTPTTIFWHALTSSPAETRSLTDIDKAAADLGTIMVYPKSPDGSWDAGGCCTNISLGKKRDETVFAKELIAQVESKVCVDKKRLYTTGFSNGGMLSHMLACKMADVFAAAAPSSGALTIPTAQCTPSRPIPIYMINGTSDPLVPYSTASLTIGSISVTDTFANWGKLNQCTGTPAQTLQKGAVTCTTYQQCGGGTTSTLCAVQGMGHCQPGMKAESATNCLTKSGIALGAPNNDIDGTRASLEFLMKQSMP